MSTKQTKQQKTKEQNKKQTNKQTNKKQKKQKQKKKKKKKQQIDGRLGRGIFFLWQPKLLKKIFLSETTWPV